MKPMEKGWFKPRMYMHITDRVRERDRDRVTRLVQNDEYIGQRHAFFPLLLKEVKTRRFKKCVDQHGHTYRSHVNRETGKSNTKIREIEYATHLDSQIFAWYRHLITERYEEYLKTIPGLSGCILAYRGDRHREPNGKGKTNVHFARDLIIEIEKREECAILTFDVERFFPSLNHRILKTAWANLFGWEQLPQHHYAVFKAATKYSYIRLSNLREKYGGFDEGRLAQLRRRGMEAFFENAAEFREKVKRGELKIFKNREKGIPHGLPISATLANLYMLEFDKIMFFEAVQTLGAIYLRYSDDIAIVCAPEQIPIIEGLVSRSIALANLSLSQDKSEVFIFKKETNGRRLICRRDKIHGYEKASALTYLGLSFDGKNTTVKPTVWAKYYRRLKRAQKTLTRRLQIVKERDLLLHLPNFWNRKICMAFTKKGSRVRKCSIFRHVLRPHPDTNEFRFVREKRMQKKWGNTLTYVNRVRRLLNNP